MTTAMNDALGEPRYRWVVLAATAVTLAVAMGQLVNGLSVYFIPLEQAFGWSRGDIALINTFGLIGLAAGGIVVGRVVDLLGARRVALTGAIVLGVCVAVSASASALWQFYALSFVAGFVGTSNLLSGSTARDVLGREGSFGIRPEKIHLEATGAAVPEGSVAADGRVHDVVYLGSDTKYHVELDAGSRLEVITQNVATSSTDALRNPASTSLACTRSPASATTFRALGTASKVTEVRDPR